jgi:hypothetical protein
MPVRGKITALAVLSVGATVGVPATASASEPGFTVDPQSPAGVEYQIPLNTARGQGGGGNGHHGGGSLSGGGSGGSGGGTSSGGGTGGPGNGSSAGSQALFGTGITPATNGSGSGYGAAGGGRNGPARDGHGSGSGSGSRTLPAALTSNADYSTSGPIAAIIAAILAVGGGFGLLLRLRARRPRRIFS